MRLNLSKSMFENGTYSVLYNNNTRRATFDIVDESFASSGILAELDFINVTIVEYDDTGAESGVYLGTSIIGIGDSYLGVSSSDSTLAGKRLNQDNMASCVIELYETV